jgi:hypothetical protein
MRSHKDEVDLEERPIDEKLVPKAVGEETVGLSQDIPQVQRSANPNQAEQQPTLRGDETTGPEFYGEGYQEKKGI